MISPAQSPEASLPGGWREITGELLLLGLTLVTLWNTGSIFEGSLFQSHLIILAVVMHLGWAVTRRLRFPLVLATLTNAVISLLVFGYLRYSDSAPRFEDEAELTGNILTDFRADWDATITILREEIVPLPLNTGFIFIVAATIFVLSGLADWSAFRVRISSGDGVVGYAIVFVVTMLFGVGNQRVLSAVLFALLAMCFALSHRIFSNRRRMPVGSSAMLRTGALVIVFVLGVGVIGGASFRPSGEATRIDLSSIQNISQGSGGPRVVLSPLVEIQSRLQNDNNVQLFTVLSDQAQYWRLTSLDNFDGQSWSSSYNYDSASGTLESDIASGTVGAASELNQSFVLNNFGTEWVPAAFEVNRLENHSRDDFDLLYDTASSTLLIETEKPSVDGLAYSIVSQVPNYDLLGLELATFNDYDDFDLSEYEQYLRLPGNLSVAALRAAMDVTSDAQTPYAKALTLQQWFRTEFSYNLDVEEGHSIDRVEDFLEIRQGYCEQFASTYAMMARMLGIPSRVVVGFTWGESASVAETLEGDFSDVDLSGDVPQQAFAVYGRHYHSWAEVLIPGAGWVLMEPTPSRGPPDSPHTQVTPEQDAVISSPVDDSEDQFLPPELQPLEEQVPENETTIISASDTVRYLWLIVAAALGLGALALAIISVRGVLYLRKTKGNTSERTLLAWRRAQLIWNRAGVGRSREMTIHEFSDKVSQQSSGLRSRNPLRQLADLTANVSYGNFIPTEEEARKAEELQKQVKRQAVLYLPKWKRILGFGITSPIFSGGRPRG